MITRAWSTGNTCCRICLWVISASQLTSSAFSPGRRQDQRDLAYKFINHIVIIIIINVGISQKSPWVAKLSSGGRQRIKGAGSFEVRTSSSQVTRMHFFLQKSWQPLFNRRHQNTKAANAAEIVSLSHYYRSKANGGGSSSQVIYLTRLTWRALV